MSSTLHWQTWLVVGRRRARVRVRLRVVSIVVNAIGCMVYGVRCMMYDV